MPCRTLSDLSFYLDSSDKAGSVLRFVVRCDEVEENRNHLSVCTPLHRVERLPEFAIRRQNASLQRLHRIDSGERTNRFTGKPS